MTLLQIPKLEFVSNVSKFGFWNSQSKQNTHIGLLKNSKQKQKKCVSKPGLKFDNNTHGITEIESKLLKTPKNSGPSFK
jgi:hypothetical protein